MGKREAKKKLREEFVKLVEYLNSQGFMYKALAEAINEGPSYVSRVKTDKNTPTPEQIQALKDKYSSFLSEYETEEETKEDDKEGITEFRKANPEANKEFLDLVELVRKKTKHTYHQIAKDMGISYQRLRSIKSNNVRVKPTEVDYFKIKYQDVINDEAMFAGARGRVFELLNQRLKELEKDKARYEKVNDFLMKMNEELMIELKRLGKDDEYNKLTKIGGFKNIE